MWSALVSLCVSVATAQFNPYGFGQFSGQQGFDVYGSYGAPEFSQFQGVTANGRDFNVNSLTGYGVPPGVNYGDQNFAAQGFGQYGAQGYPGVEGGAFPQGPGQNHLQQGAPAVAHSAQQEGNAQHGAQAYSNGGQGQAPVIGQPGQSVLNPGHQQNVPLPNQIGANQADGQGHPQSHHASQQLSPQLEHQHQVGHHQQQHHHHHQEPQRLHQAPGGHGEAQIGSGHVPSQHFPNQAGHPGGPEGQFEVNYNGVSQYPEQYQGQQLGLQVPQQYQQQTQQHHGEKSASSPSAASAPLESSGFKGIPLEAFAQANYGQRHQSGLGDQQHPRSSGETHSQRAHDQTEESTKKEVKKSS